MIRTKTAPPKYTRSIQASKSGKHVVLADCGTGIADEAMQAVLRETDTLVLVTTATPDATGLAEDTLNWLNTHGYPRLATNSIAVINGPPVSEGPQLHARLRDRCRAVIDIPPDPCLARGSVITLDELAENTRYAYLALAAAVMDTAVIDAARRDPSARTSLSTTGQRAPSTPEVGSRQARPPTIRGGQR